MAMIRGGVAKKVVATKIVAADGSGDFTDIQDAIDALPSGGGVVYIKEGTYTITSQIIINKDNTSLKGAGASTKIKTDGNITMISGDNLMHIGIHDLYLYGAGTGNTSNHGIVWNKVSESSITGCWIETCGGDGIQFLGDIGGGICTKCTIINNIIKGNGGNGIQISIT